MSKKIVIIEDNDDVRENIAEILELSNYEVYAAPNGKEGVRIIKEKMPDLVLCDIMMPELDGYGVIKILASNPATQNIPFIFLSAKSEKEDFRSGMNLGADDYITKPFEDVQLLEAIELRLKKKKLVSLTVDHDESELENIENFYSPEKAVKAIEQLFCSHSAEEFNKKDMLFSCGSKPRFIYRIEKGNFKTYEINEDGKELITGLYSAGDIMGLSDVFEGKSYSECSKALTKGYYKKVMRSDVLKLIYQDRDVAMYFYRKLSNSVNIRKLRLLNFAYDSVRKRTADSLLWLDDVFNKDKKYPFSVNFNRDDLAAMVGTAKESVIRQLTSFKEEKLIDTEQSEIVILNRRGLEEIYG
jgi:CRP/FNR family transcriptional regulator, polysaccharide utilization system transcription regulator